jgi:hypothetical protein
MSHSLCVMGVYDEVKMTVPMVVRYVHSDKKEKRNTIPGDHQSPSSPSLLFPAHLYRVAT